MTMWCVRQRSIFTKTFKVKINLISIFNIWNAQRKTQVIIVEDKCKKKQRKEFKTYNRNFNTIVYFSPRHMHN